MHPISEVLCKTYAQLFKSGDVKFPLHEDQKNKIDSVVKTVNANVFGVERFPTPEDKAVAYLCFLIKDHPVTDGNKRLALLWFTVYCKVSGLSFNTETYSLDELAVAIERIEGFKMDNLMALVKDILFGK